MDISKLTEAEKAQLSALLSKADAEASAEPEKPVMTSDEARQVLNETLSLLAANCPALSVEQRLKFEEALGVEG